MCPLFSALFAYYLSRSACKIIQTGCSQKLGKNTIHPPLVSCTLKVNSYSHKFCKIINIFIFSFQIDLMISVISKLRKPTIILGAIYQDLESVKDFIPQTIFNYMFIIWRLLFILYYHNWNRLYYYDYAKYKLDFKCLYKYQLSWKIISIPSESTILYLSENCVWYGCWMTYYNFIRDY